MDEKILTLHPQGKQGVRISRDKYEQVKTTILEVMQEQGELTFTQLSRAVESRLEGNFEGSIPWYVVSVKLDLEARGTIQRLPNTRPEKLHLNLDQEKG
jgi:hypothetical protein